MIGKLNHVAFAGLTKFDGVRMRRLLPAEMAQIAGLDRQERMVDFDWSPEWDTI